MSPGEFLEGEMPVRNGLVRGWHVKPPICRPKRGFPRRRSQRRRTGGGGVAWPGEHFNYDTMLTCTKLLFAAVVAIVIVIVAH